MKQQWTDYKKEDFLVWKTLFERQQQNLQGKVCSEYLEALESMSPVLRPDKVPCFDEIDEWFQASTGWTIEVVPGLIPVEEFFDLLAQKKFCSSTWLRRMDQLDYLEEPDMFHDIFGHIPLLSNPVFSQFMQEFGAIGQKWQHHPELVLQMQRLYWFTIEFGLVGKGDPLIYGAGIISSFGETNRAISPLVPKELFAMDSITERMFHTDAVQESYVQIESFESLFSSLMTYHENTKRQLVSL